MLCRMGFGNVVKLHFSYDVYIIVYLWYYGLCLFWILIGKSIYYVDCNVVLLFIDLCCCSWETCICGCCYYVYFVVQFYYWTSVLLYVLIYLVQCIYIGYLGGTFLYLMFVIDGVFIILYLWLVFVFDVNPHHYVIFIILNPWALLC
jgi:hypothetical protein